ncbi:LacI family DNA-binding transcriptional regulator [bacterium AH-315-I18]|nr:LacI family DNA-binding transcriptional regulator [bacterium AH-315-I18]
MVVTLDDIASHIGVTKTTVSLVLNSRGGKTRISQTTTDRIRQAAKDLDYRPSFSAQALTKGKTSSFGFICGAIDSPFLAEMTALALREAKQRNHHLLLAATQWETKSELEAFELLLARGVDGIMMFSSAITPDSDQYRYIHSHQFPTVIMDQISGDLPMIFEDFLPGMMQAVEHLKDRGCRSVGYVGHWPASRLKFPCFEQACKHHNLKASSWPCEVDPDLILESGRAFARNPDRPDAVIVVSDMAAIIFMQGLTEEGLRVPEDVAVIGSDDIRMARFMNPPLTTIIRDRTTMVTQAGLADPND